MTEDPSPDQGRPELGGPPSPEPEDQPDPSAPPLLPHYDALVLGTGVTEAMVAGALAKGGQQHGTPPTILHVEENAFYGGHHAVFTLHGLLEWLLPPAQAPADRRVGGEEQDPTEELNLSRQRSSYSDVELAIGCWECRLPARREGEGRWEPTWTRVPEPWARLACSLESADSMQGESPSADQLDLLKEYRQRFPALEPLLASCLPPQAPSPAVPAILARLLAHSRDFNLELCPTLVHAGGRIVDMLIHSEVGRYVEFKAPEESYVWLPSSSPSLQLLPGSKEDIFLNQSIGLREKRLLMKCISTLLALPGVGEPATLPTQEDAPATAPSPVATAPSLNAPLLEYLRTLSLCPASLQMLLSITMITDPARLARLSVAEGAARLKLYLTSVGRFSKSGFLLGIFGAGSELSQAFCRTCAVYGGTYVMGRGVRVLPPTKEGRLGIRLAGLVRPITCDHLVTSASHLPPLVGDVEPGPWVQEQPGASTPSPPSPSTNPATGAVVAALPTARAILVVDAPLLPRHPALIILPPALGREPRDDGANGDAPAAPGILLLQQGPESSVCPPGTFLLHALSNGGSSESLKAALAGLLQERPACLADESEREPSRARVLLSLFYTQRPPPIRPMAWPGLHLVSPVAQEGLELEAVVVEAARIATTILPACAPFFPEEVRPS